MRKTLLPLAAMLLVGVAFPTAALADDQEIINGGFGLGLGYSDLDVDGSEGDFMALAQYRGEAFEIQLDYVLGDNTVWALHGDYIWNAEREPESLDSGLYLGAGYSYVSFDGDSVGAVSNDDTDSGFNVLLGFDFDANWGAEARWTMLGDDYINANVFYSFGDDSNSDY